jgi:hypothetical protein
MRELFLTGTKIKSHQFYGDENHILPKKKKLTLGVLINGITFLPLSVCLGQL